MKRLFDVLVASLALLLLWPLLLVIAVWVRFDSPGPVLFRQERIGRGGRPFRVLKFRSMRTDAAGSQITIGADPRITRSGAWLRRHKLDELPQFINVIKGDMSVVGPRPEVPRYVAMYPPEVRDTVLSVRPGITDLASLEFRDESALLARSADPEKTYVEDILPRKLRYCTEYARSHSLFTDFKIILRTARTLCG